MILMQGAHMRQAMHTKDMTMKTFKLIILILSCFLLTDCNSNKINKIEDYKLNSYLDIKVDSAGRLPENPYIVDLTSKNKHLIVIGTLHSVDTTNKMFADIEKIFYQFKPEIIINEGGNLTKKYNSRNEAIKKNGELGLEKYLADNAGIKTINGDIPDSSEFFELTKAYSKEEALVFFASERFVLPFTYYFNEKPDLENLYKPDFIDGYLLSSGISLTKSEQDFLFYKTAYKKYFKCEFNIDSIHSDDFSPIRTNNHFCEIARKSKELRDRYLLDKIQEQLNKHNKVLVIFGGWHVLAIEPALTQIIKKTE